MADSRGSRTHIDVAAVHEAGHAIAVVREGRRVGHVRVGRDAPGSGVVTHSRHGQTNPYDPARGAGSARAAWQHTLARYSTDLRISLAGPVAEAKALGQPLRSLGAYSDLENCRQLAESLEACWGAIRPFAEIEPLNTAQWMNHQRARVRRWLGQPKTWYLVTRVADLLSRQGFLYGQDIYRELARVQAPAPQLPLAIHVLATFPAERLTPRDGGNLTLTDLRPFFALAARQENAIDPVQGTTPATALPALRMPQRPTRTVKPIPANASSRARAICRERERERSGTHEFEA